MCVCAARLATVVHIYLTHSNAGSAGGAECKGKHIYLVIIVSETNMTRPGNLVPNATGGGRKGGREAAGWQPHDTSHNVNITG